MLQLVRWNLKTGAAAWRDAVAARSGHDGPVRALCAVGEGLLASGGGDGRVFIWDPVTGQKPREQVGFSGPIYDLCELNKILYSGSFKITVAPVGPLRYGVMTNIDVRELRDRAARFTALQKPILEFVQRAIVTLVTALQIASFCITPVTAPHLPSELKGAFSFAKDLGFTTISMSVSFEIVYYSTVGGTMIFLVTMMRQERLETKAFLQQHRNRGCCNAKYSWLAAKTFVELASTVLFISVFRTLLRGLDCTHVDTGSNTHAWSMDALAVVGANSSDEASASGSAADLDVIVGLECWGIQHSLQYALPSIFCMFSYGYLSFRLLAAGSDLSVLEIDASRPFNRRGDGTKSQPHVHPLSFASTRFSVATVISKMVVATAEVLLTHYILVYSTTLVATTGAVALLTHKYPPYYGQTFNRLQLGIQFAVTGCAVAQFIVTVRTVCTRQHDNY